MEIQIKMMEIWTKEKDSKNESNQHLAERTDVYIKKMKPEDMMVI